MKKININIRISIIRKMEDYRDYPYIPRYRFEMVHNQSKEFLKTLNERLEMLDKYSKWKREMDRKIKQEEEKNKKKYEELVTICDHNYEAQPREYQCPREWICSYCYHSC